MNLPLTYREFLEAKIVTAPVGGFEVALDDINPLLKPHQKAIVQWACRGGRRAIFAACTEGRAKRLCVEHALLHRPADSDAS